MKTLADYPDLCAQLVNFGDDNVDPTTLRFGSGKRLKWRCNVGADHVWVASVHERTSGRGCPFCAGKRPSETNSLASIHPEIATLWHPTKNGELTPNNVTAGSKKRVWWKCPNGHDHEWVTDVGSKVRSGCPFCSGKKVSITNCLHTLSPELANQWHPTLNEGLTPFSVTHGSAKSVWWQCEEVNSHYWKATVSSRTLAGNGCPYCSNKKVCETNSLANCFPKIAKQWHPTKNGDQTPNDVVGGSRLKVWWQCNVGADHVWKASPEGRTSRGDGCPFCGPSPRYASSTNNLLLKYPEIAKQWHPTMNGDVTPDKVLTNTTKSFWWLCEFGHYFKSNCNQRVTARVTCPYCSGYRIGQGNSFADKCPEAAAEWDYEKNGSVTPDKIAPSSDKKRWFVCKLGHSYKTNVKYRTAGHGCPHCTNQSSQQELRIYTELKSLFDDTVHKHRIGKVELDVYVPSLNLAIEFDGAFWHKQSNEKDKRKNEFCNRKGISLIRVRQSPLEKTRDADIIVENRSLKKTELNQIVRTIFQNFLVIDFEDKRISRYLSLDDFANEELFQEYKTYLPLPHPTKSLAVTNPALLELWDFEKNYPLKPEHFTPGSNRRVFWVCRRGHSYESAIITRVNALGCPVCYRNRGKSGKRSQTIRDKKQMNLF